MKLPFNLICIDIEATDSDAYSGSMVQLSAIKVDQKFNLKKTREFDEIIQPLDFHRNLRAMACHGLTEEQMQNGISLAEALSKFEDFCGREKILAAWGAYFDIPYLRIQYDKINRKWPFHYRSFDLKSVAIWELAKRNKPLPGGVNKFLNLLKLDFEGTPHNAIDDIKNSVKILKYLKTCKRIK